MKQIEWTLNSREVANMMEKAHNDLLKDIRRYIGQFDEVNLPRVDFFRESTYEDKKGETRPCFQITKKGCEFIAHKLTGTKGTVFTARYINRFHEMENALSDNRPKRPWFIRSFRGQDIMLFQDFKTITGIELFGNYTAYKFPGHLVGGRDYNGWNWMCDKDKFKAEFGFDCGDDNCMMYLYKCGIAKAVDLVEQYEKGKLLPAAKRMIFDGLKNTEKPEITENVPNSTIQAPPEMKPIQICITINGKEISLVQ